MTRGEHAEQLLAELSTRIRESITLRQEGHRKEAIGLWHRSIVESFVQLWLLVSRPEHKEDLQKVS